MTKSGKFRYHLLLLLVVCVALAGFSLSTAAQIPQITYSITPSHVYQATEEFRLQLENLGLIDRQIYESAKPDRALRHPRHVIQKVRECHTILSKVLLARDLEPEPVPGLFSSREIRPADVRNGVQHLLKETEKLGGKISQDVPFVDGKLPGDVYNNLKRICEAVNIQTVASDVYQVAVAVRENMENIAHSQGYKISYVPDDLGEKTVKDLYLETWALLDDMRNLALIPDYAIPGGVIIPNKQDENKVNMRDVMSLMNDALSGTDAIKYTLNVNEETVLPGYSEGKTEKDVFGEISNIRFIVNRVIEFEAALDKDGAE